MNTHTTRSGGKHTQLDGYIPLSSIECICVYVLFASIDATEESDRVGRLINHTRRSPNLSPRVEMVDGVPLVYFVATKDIHPGQELLFDYYECRKDVVAQMPSDMGQICNNNVLIPS